MTRKKWYPAAAVSAVVLGCGGIDTGGPANTSGGMVTYYGMRTGGAGTADGYGGYVATGGKEPTGGYPATGGRNAMYRIPGVCTPGADQTCNDIATVSILMGHCEPDGGCNCGTDYFNKWGTGKCTSYEQTVCYSPTQYVDNAYVDRAFGCICDSATTPPSCGIDSSGLRAYLVCTDDNWQSGDTSNCSGSDPKVCFSPTKNVENALAANGIGCSCDTATSALSCVQIAGDAGAGTNGHALEFSCNGDRWTAIVLDGDC